jgi:hypothetical protein
MLLAFELTMPNVGSWNGKWTGSDRLYVKILNFTQRYGTSKAAKEKLDSIKDKSFYYNFGDGWSASVSVKQVDVNKAAKLRSKSAGFYGYDWMIDSILQYGKILNSSQIKELEVM